MWDDDAGYSRDDPKHPGWAESRAERADNDRKADRENHEEGEPETLAQKFMLSAETIAELREHGIEISPWKPQK